MECPKCGKKMKTVTTRDNGKYIIRFRRCEKCKFKVKTIES